MISNDTMVKVTNRDNGRVGYQIPDLRIERIFESNETKEVTAEEIRKLSYQIGGLVTLKECLIIDNEDLINEILHHVEPEYYYNSEDVKNLLLNGSVDQLLDALDFAPSSVVDMIKALSVELEIPDINKRKAILSKTNFDVSKAIEIKEITNEIEEVEEEEKPVVRREETKTNNNAPVRRAVAPKKYNVVD